MHIHKDSQHSVTSGEVPQDDKEQVSAVRIANTTLSFQELSLKRDFL